MPIATTLALAAIAVPLPLKQAPSAKAHHSALPGLGVGACAAMPSTTGVIVAVYGMLSTKAPTTDDPNSSAVAATNQLSPKADSASRAECADDAGVHEPRDHREQTHEEHQR